MRHVATPPSPLRLLHVSRAPKLANWPLTALPPPCCVSLCESLVARGSGPDWAVSRLPPAGATVCGGGRACSCPVLASSAVSPPEATPGPTQSTDASLRPQGGDDGIDYRSKHVNLAFHRHHARTHASPRGVISEGADLAGHEPRPPSPPPPAEVPPIEGGHEKKKKKKKHKKKKKKKKQAEG